MYVDKYRPDEHQPVDTTVDEAVELLPTVIGTDVLDTLHPFTIVVGAPVVGVRVGENVGFVVGVMVGIAVDPIATRVTSTEIAMSM